MLPVPAPSPAPSTLAPTLSTRPSAAPTTNISRAPSVVPAPAPTLSFPPTADPTFTRYPSVSPTLTPAPSVQPTPAPTKMPNTPAPTKWVRPEGDGLLSLAASLNITMGVTVFVCVVFHCVGSIFRPQLNLIPQEHTDAAH
jgi:hypothetical protein